MSDRSFNEVELRRMLEHARDYREDIVEGRWVIEVRRRRANWEVIVEPGLIIDFARGGRPIGIEITTPSKFSLAAFNRVLKSLGLSAASRSAVAPVRAA